MAEQDYGAGPKPVSGWAVGGTVFAGVIMILVGSFHAITGLSAIIKDQFFVVGNNYSFNLDTTAWGWIHLFLGILVVVAGAYIFSGSTWARIIGMTLAALSAIANFFFIPYYPFWAIVIIALDVWVIWALSRPIEDLG
jgi:uncharacterized membrane protein